MVVPARAFAPKVGGLRMNIARKGHVARGCDAMCGSETRQVEREMNRTLAWLAAVSACLLATGCTDKAGDKQPDLSVRSEPDAGLKREPDSGAQPDSGAAAEPALEDQTPPSGANGLAFDAAGMLWVADLFGNQVLRIDPSTGKIIDRFAQQGAGPDDIAIDTRGRVFWTGWSNGQVGRIDPRTHENAIIAELPPGANSIAFSADGRLFVGLVLLNSGLYEVDPEGASDPRLLTDPASSLNAFAFGPGGFLFGPLTERIVKIDIETGDIVDTVATGAYASVRYNRHDNSLYALANGDGKSASPALDKIDLEHGGMTRFAELNIKSIDNFVIDSTGRFFVTGFDTPVFVEVEPDGSNGPLTKIGEAGKD
jgi:outer membrane protein assembly factor BamB